MEVVLGRVEEPEDLERLYFEFNALLNEAGFTLHKWHALILVIS